MCPAPFFIADQMPDAWLLPNKKTDDTRKIKNQKL